MYRKMNSKGLCLGFTWGIFSWIDYFKNGNMPSFVTSAPVFLSIKINNALINNLDFVYDKNIFIITVILCGFIGYLFSILIKTIILVFTEE